MRTIGCSAARRQVQAFHDRELQVSREIAVGAHLERCDDCAAVCEDLRLIREAVRATAPGRAVLSRDEAASFQAAIVNRVKAERDTAFGARVRGMFEDMHFVYAGLGATAAALACVFLVLGMMRFATSVRPGSLAALVGLLASPGSNENPVAVDARVRLPRALDTIFSAGAGVVDGNEEDAVFALAAVVTREGRVTNLELLHATRSWKYRADQARLAEALLDALSHARFEPARVAGLPVAVNMIWLVAHTTVRATKAHPALALPVAPAVKKHVARIAGAHRRLFIA